jgi:2-dehydro-3-deoxygluconokinase
MQAARRFGAVVSYDLNYRPSLWKAAGGRAKAIEVNRKLASLADVLIGIEEDFSAALGFVPSSESRDPHVQMTHHLMQALPNLKMVATTLRVAKTACANDWQGLLVMDGQPYYSRKREAMPVLDRVGGGDGFASGLIYGFLTGQDPAWCVECGAAHGALVMTTPGDTSMATLDEVLQCMTSTSAGIER